MEQSQVIRKWSELQGIAVVSLADGKKVGTCDDFYFEPRTQEVYALRVKTGLLSHKMLPVASISAIGKDAVTTVNEGELRGESEGEPVVTALAGQNLHKYRVLSESGNLVGTIGNILFDVTTPTKPQIAAFELAGGLRELLGRRYPTFPAAQVVSYGQDVLVIPDAIAQTLK